MKFNSDDDLPLKKTLKLCDMIIVARTFFHEGNKCFQQVFLDGYLYKFPKINDNKIFANVIILRLGETKLAKEDFYDAKKNNKNLGCWC